MPQWIVIENLEIRGAHTPNTFTGPDRRHRDLHGARLRHLRRERREHHDPQLRHAQQRQRLLRLLLGHDRQPQHPGRGQLHPRQRERRQQSSSTTSTPRRIGITFQYNHLGSAAAGRGRQQPEGPLGRAASSATTGSRAATASSTWSTPRTASLVRDDPRYRETYVYGNVLIETADSGNNDICYYGGDGGSAQKFRKGTLYFYNNTVVSDRTDNTTALPPVDQRREHRRAQQHRVRDGGGQPTCRCSTTTAG